MLSGPHQMSNDGRGRMTDGHCPSSSEHERIEIKLDTKQSNRIKDKLAKRLNHREEHA